MSAKRKYQDDQVIHLNEGRLDEGREQREDVARIEKGELESPVTPEPAAAETVAERPVPAGTPVEPAVVFPPKKAKRNRKRPLLFALLPVALIAGGYVYVTGGAVMTTDNAYLRARSLSISTDVSGTVAEIDVHNNEVVKKGQVLFRLRPDSFRTALDAAKAQLGTVRNQVLTLKASYQQALAGIAQAKADLPYYQETLQRQKDLLATSTASKAAYDQARHDLVTAQQKVTVAEAQAKAVLAQLGNDPDQPVEQNPFYLQAKSAVEDAQRDYNDSIVKAPFDGVVTNVDALQVGRYLPDSTPAFSLVSQNDLWVEASPKETELTYVRPGQKATITVDTYPGVEWHGKVTSISPASAASFSLLPAQNTSGNWVKVVQRIPMRVSIEDPAGKPPLRAGMSVEVDVETGHARGFPLFLKNLFGGSGKSHG
ncbi:MAG: HlyD family secretion protein [Rhizobiaceae bacterium]|nr:MAG: HlyD family secretion protein [Rhizobiaceae bacterium]